MGVHGMESGGQAGECVRRASSFMTTGGRSHCWLHLPRPWKEADGAVYQNTGECFNEGIYKVWT